MRNIATSTRTVLVRQQLNFKREYITVLAIWGINNKASEPAAGAPLPDQAQNPNRAQSTVASGATLIDFRLIREFINWGYNSRLVD